MLIEHIKGKGPNKSKNYTRMGGNKQQYKWIVTLNNGKKKTVWANDRYNATHGQPNLSPEDHIIGIKSAKKAKALAEGVIKSYEGSIDEKKLDDMIKSVIKTYKMDPKSFQDIKDVTIEDYQDSDISQVTPHDIVEIIDASGFEPGSDFDDDE